AASFFGLASDSAAAVRPWPDTDSSGDQAGHRAARPPSSHTANDMRMSADPTDPHEALLFSRLLSCLLQHKQVRFQQAHADRGPQQIQTKERSMLTRRTAMFSAAIAAMMLAAPAVAEDLKLPRQKVDLVAPPFVHAHEQATKQGPKIVEFKLTIEEKKVVIDEKGTTFQAMTFNGSMPGPLMVVHEGDYVETTLVNPGTNTMPHNIDFHSATGALGGGALTLINPGEQVVLRWKATRTDRKR